TFNYNSLPVVTITEPGSNFRFNVGGSVTIKGTAVDLDGTLTKVEIYSPHIPNSTVILTAPPYEATFTNMQSSGNRGLTTFVIKATDDKGGVNGAMIDVYENKLPVVTV